MPAPRKIWLPSNKKSSPKTTTVPSPAELIAYPTGSLEQSLPIWALAPLITALLGRDNRKIPPTRTEPLLKALREFILLINSVEAQSIEFPQAMKDQLVAWFTRDALTIKPPAHPQHILILHSHRVDQLLLEKDWPVRIEGKKGRYHSTLRHHLPLLLAELANYQHCNSDCPGRVSPDADDICAFADITSPGVLRDAIVAYHHGIAPASMRGARARRRIRRHRKK